MEHIYMRIPVRKWSIDLKIFFFFLSNSCKGTRLLEPNVATPLYGTLDDEKHNTTQYVFDTTISQIT